MPLRERSLCIGWVKSRSGLENQSYRASGLTLLTAAISLEYGI
ncbi:hypothetical protein BANRA_05447 [Klebsiella pneumoniae]|nr:hypothetical protein BANRA_05447 [Klebsiella pneumoniae]